MWYCPLGASASLTRTSNPLARSGRAAATAAASDAWRPKDDLGDPGLLDHGAATELPHGLARLVGGREARGGDHEQSRRVLLAESHRRVPQPVELPLQPVRSLPRRHGPALERVSFRAGGSGWRVVTGAPLAGVSGGPGARSGGTPPLSVASGPAGIATTEGRGAARPGHRGQGPPRRSTRSHAMTGDQHDHARGREGHMGVPRDQPAHRRLEMMFKTVLGEVKTIVGGARWPETA